MCRTFSNVLRGLGGCAFRLRWDRVAWVVGMLGVVGGAVGAEPRESVGVVLSVAGSSQLFREGSVPSLRVKQGMTVAVGDRLITGEKSRVSLRLQDLTVLRVPGQTVLEFKPPRKRGGSVIPSLQAGQLYLNNRVNSGEVLLETPTASCAIQGTELVLAVGDEGRIEVSVLEGRVEVRGDAGTRVLRDRERAGVAPDGVPHKLPRLEATHDLIQWCLYYPAVLDPSELLWTATELELFAASLEVYSTGDVLGAVASLPVGGGDQRSPTVQVYLAGLDLAVGDVLSAASRLGEVELAAPDRVGTAGVEATSVAARLGRALAQHISTVKGLPDADAVRMGGATEAMVESYARQAVGELAGALRAARRAVEHAPEFGFAWVRVAELEFSFGRSRVAADALAEARRLSPRNAQAMVLEGFVHSARGRRDKAAMAFNRAIELEGCLGDAWLGRGLLKLRSGEVFDGLRDLQVASAQEPQRAVLRSYLGKAFQLAGDDRHAIGELALAKAIDPRDPTAWLYEALVDYQRFRTTSALENLQESIVRNDNRQLYRSRLLLEQDRAARSANLAKVYEDAGMPEVALQESARALAADYANASAHLNLAASYDAMRDPSRFNLRYDTLWLSEHLVSSLLAPVGAVPLSQSLSQMEYTQLLDADRVGLNGTLDLYSTGEFRSLGAQYGTVGPTSWALDVDYHARSAVAVNDWFNRLEWYTRVKQQLTTDHSVLVLVKYQDYESGDNFQYYDPYAEASAGYQFRDSQAPIVMIGGQHEWGPGMRTLYLAGRLVDDREIRDPERRLPAVFSIPGGGQAGATARFDHAYASQFESYGVELQQVWQREQHTDVLGGRFYGGTIDATDDLELNDPAWEGTGFFDPTTVTSTSEDVQHAAAYLYHTWRPLDSLSLQGGVAYEHALYPKNFRRPPLTPGDDSTEVVLPKGSIVWRPTRIVTIRGIYAQSLGEIGYGQSFRLEPTQLAGFGQTYRSIASDSVLGSTEAALHEVAAGAVDLRLGSRTFGAIEGGWLGERGDRTSGLLEGTVTVPPAAAGIGSYSEDYDYQETYARLVLNRIVAGDWFAGLSYQFTHSWISFNRPTLAGAGFGGSSESADLHQPRAFLQFSPPSGWFARFEAGWVAQQNSDPDLDDDSFPELNVFLGHRFAGRRGEVRVGVINLTDDAYRINPLNPHPEWFRQRTFVLRVRFNL